VSANPYVDSSANWSARSRYVSLRYYRSPEDRERVELASDLRRGMPFALPYDLTKPAKERYCWAEHAFMAGLIDIKTWHREVTWFDEAVAMWRAQGAAREAAINDELEQGEEAWLRHEKHRMRRLAREGYVDRERWTLVLRREQEHKEFIERWEHERAQRRATATQRAFLREGRATLAAIRRHLRAPVSSRRQVSAPARTSPIS
jgi:hypothetical protein